MLEGTVLSSTVSNIFTLACGLFLGFVIKGWLRQNGKQEAEAVVHENSVAEESFSDFVAGDQKLVLVVQNGLKMGKGKIAAQCSHASVMAYKSCCETRPETLKKWLKSGQRKVVVKVDNEDEMLNLANQARQNGLPISLVCDAGRTQIPSGSRTVLGIGPGPECMIDVVTGHLKLL